MLSFQTKKQQQQSTEEVFTGFPGWQKVMHTAHFTLPKHTNSDQPSTEAAKKNVLAENHLNTRLSENTDSMFLPFKTESRHQFQEIWRTCLGLNLTYILLHQRQGQAVNMGRY